MFVLTVLLNKKTFANGVHGYPLDFIVARLPLFNFLHKL